MKKRFIVTLFVIILFYPFYLFANSKVGVSCQHEEPSLNCDIRLFSANSVNQIIVTTNGQEGKLPSTYVSYSEAGGKTAMLFVVDTSDPRRKKALAQTRSFLKKVVKSSSSDILMGIAGFDSSLTVMVKIGSSRELLLKGVDKLKAKGKTTELYRSTRDAVKELSLVPAKRKALILLSDGKSEDTAYFPSDVIALAKKEKVVIYGLAFLEKKNSVDRQALYKLSEETGGPYRQAEEDGVPKDFVDNFYNYISNGGAVDVDLSNVYGKNKLKFSIEDSKGATEETYFDIDLPQEPVLAIPPKKPWWFLYRYYLYGGVALLLGGFFIRWLIKRRKILYACFESLDSNPQTYSMYSNIIRLGRSEECDVYLENDSVSSFHAGLKLTRENEFVISDLGSTNKVYVNGEEITEGKSLCEGDVIELGEVRLRFHPLIGLDDRAQNHLVEDDGETG